MKNLLLIIPLLAGCTREYEFDAGTIDADTGEFHSIGAPSAGEGDSGPAVHGAEKNISTVTLDWPEGEKETVEQCEGVYHNLTCRYEKVN